MDGGQRAKEDVNRRAGGAWPFELAGVQVLVGQHQLAVGWDDVDVIGGDAQPFGLHLDDRHGRVPLEQLVEDAFVIGRQMGDNDVGQTGVVRQGVEEGRQRL